MMEILDQKPMKMHDTEFKLMTSKIGSYERKDLFKVVNGQDELLMGMLNSYKEGLDYLENEYMKDWKVFQDFTKILMDAIREKIFLFDFDETGTDSCMRYIYCDYEGRRVTVEVCTVIEVGFGRVMSAAADWIQVMNDSKLDSLMDRFAYDLFRIFNEFFKKELVA